MKNHPLLRLLKVLAAVLFLTTAAGSALAGPGISVTPAGPVGFGNVLVNTTSSTASFVIMNPGDAALFLSPAPSITGANPTKFTISSPATSPVPASMSSNLVVTCTPGSTTGPLSATLHIPNNAGSAVDIALTATGTAPEIQVFDGATEVSDNIGTRTVPTVDLGATPNGSTSETFTIKNTLGTGNLIITGISVLNSTEFAVTAGPTPSTVGVGGTSTFTVTFTPGSRGLNKTAQIVIANNDLDEGSFRINLTADATAPEIDVADSIGTLTTGGRQPSFGTSIPQGSDQTLDLTISNSGTSTLNYGAITFTGLTARDFSVISAATGTISAAGSPVTITVQFHATDLNSISSTLSIPNNDPDGSESPFLITFTATVVAREVRSDNTFGYVLTELAGKQTAPYLLLTDPDVVDTGLKGWDAAAPIDIGFNFSFYDKTYDRCAIAITGLITFGGQSTNFTAAPIPSTSAPDEFIAPLWMDMKLGSDSRIVFKHEGTAPNRSFTIKYDHVQQWSKASKIFTFQVQLHEGTNAIDIQYKDETPTVPFNVGNSIPSSNDLYTIGIESRNYGTVPGSVVNDVVGINYRNGHLPAGTPSSFFPPSLRFARPVIITLESKYQQPNDAATTVTCTSTASLAVGMTVTGVGNIAPGSTIVAITDLTHFVLSAPATAVGMGLTLTAKPAIGSVVTLVGCATNVPFTSQDAGKLPSLGLNPPIGTIYKTLYGTVQRFEAPEFIYLTKDFVELPGAGDVSDSPADLAWYRLVNDGYALDGQVVQGTTLFFTTTLMHDVTVVWRWRLEYAVFVDSPVVQKKVPEGQQNGFGEPAPVVGRHWYGPGSALGAQLTASINTDVTDLEGGIRAHTAGYTLFDKRASALGATTFNPDNAVRRAIVPIAVTQPLRLKWDLIGQVRYRFDAFSSDKVGAPFDGHSFVKIYKAKDTIKMTDPSMADTGGFPPNGIVYGLGINTTAWIDLGRKVDVGAFYKSSDNKLTLSGFAGTPGGDFSKVASVSDDLEDAPDFPAQSGSTRVARIYTVPDVTSPTDVHWTYDSTVFRAEIPLGQSLAVEADGTVLNGQLTPPLPTSAVLRVADAGPGNSITTKRGPSDGSNNKVGDALRWDGLDKALFPVQPGAYEVAWPDGNDPAKTYRVEVLTGFPGQTVTRTFASEDDKSVRILEGEVDLVGCMTDYGKTTVNLTNAASLLPNVNPAANPPKTMRIRGPNIATGTMIVSVTTNAFVLSIPATGTSTAGVPLTAWTNYRNMVTLAEIDPEAGFPAQAEHAHYHHLFDPDAAKQAPTKLDLSTTDEWKFQDLTYAELSTGASVNKAAAGIPFAATGIGRSVLLYSYRPNPDEVADGTLSQEKLAVRVVRSSPVSVIARTDPKLVLGQHGLQLGGGPPALGGAFGIVGSGGGVDPGTQFVVDFWLNAKGLQASSAVALTNCTTNVAATTVGCASTAGLAAGMSISGQNMAPGTKVASITNGTTFVLSVAATGNGTALSLTASYSAVTLTNCVTNGTTTVTCASTAEVVAGMTISGSKIVPGTKIAAVSSPTKLVLTAAATGSGTGLLTAANKPVTVLSSGSGGLKVALDASAATVTATYRGIPVTHSLPMAGAAWRHYVVHVFTQEVFGTPVTVVDFYVDGVREEQALPTAMLAAGSPLVDDSFRLGVDVDPVLGLQLDQFRLFSFPAFPSDELGYLSPAEVRRLKTEREMTPTTIASVSSSSQFVLSKPATGSGTALTLKAGAVTLTNCTTVVGSTTVTCDSNPALLALTNIVVSGSNVTADFRGRSPSLWFSFETAPSGGAFANQVAPTAIGIGPVAGATPFAGTWANVDVQEVATRIDSTLDNAGFGGSGFIRNEVSNYNADLYKRTAEIGGWGPIFPVNDAGQIFNNDPVKKLEVVYYENPYLVDRVPHPNVAWPYITTEYRDVIFPAVGPHKDKAIYIASRIGSEGVDQIGRPQKVFELSKYSGLKIYNQPDQAKAGYNPNEEHALTAPSGRAAVKVKNLGEALANNPPLAAFALQKDVNNKPSGTYTSAPWVLVQVNNLQTGEPEMAAYQVFATRAGAVAFPRPTDAQVSATPGLAYDVAATPEARFLALAPGTTFNFEYKFDYPVLAGDLLVPPYPLNLVIGNVSLADERGGNIQIKDASNNDLNQRTLWRDAGRHAWVVSGGGGKFFEQYFYPMRADFYLPGADIGKPIAWLRANPAILNDFLGDNLPGNPTLDDDPKPVKVQYTSAWRSDYPKLKRGETLTYLGGEYFNENPGSNGLPAVVAMKAAEVVYDSATPTMVISSATTDELDKASARIIRPLDRREYSFTNAQMIAANLIPGDPASSKVIVVAERWYFKDLTGSLQKRFYFDSLAETLVFRGRLNDKEGGDPNLTQGPDPINVLEPDVLTLDDYHKLAPDKGLYDLATSGDWQTAINAIFTKSQNPNGVTSIAASTTAPVFLQGVKPVPSSSTITAAQRALLNEQKTFWRADLSGTVTGPDPVLSQLDSFGVGSALVPNANLLTMNPAGSLYVTVAENNRAELNGAPVSLHIVEIIPDRYRGAIKVIEGSDAFSEKITLQHNGEFGANTGKLDYEWWIRDTRALDDTLRKEIDSLSTSLPDSNWQLYTSGQGLHTIVFQGRPDVILADKLVLMRYRHVSEKTLGWKAVPFDLAATVTMTNCTTNGTTTVTCASTAGLAVGMTISGTNIAGGTKVASINSNATTFVLNTATTGSGTGFSLTAAFSDVTAATAWKPGNISPTSSAPFQWAGAANSPQFQADGSQRYIPQLVMGWVKRILDRINPYEARYSDFFSNESPASYTSQIQIAGGPYAGNVALNPDKNVIENTGLIELYRTVLNRAEALSINNSSNGNATDGINQALLLAATRLTVLYELLAREAYSDAQDSTISVPADSGLANVASFTFAFQNLEPDLLHEELSLLRGTDFRKSYPVYNRMFWNYAKGLGEAAYNVNYNISDVNKDGFINESDARLLYPQGHGDAWGHFLSALDMHYLLLQNPNFSWKARSELYSLLQNVFPVDYLDEKTFAKVASGKARAGRDIVRDTYRLNYTQNPDGQWQGYTDGADPARAWGVSEWAHRVGQGAYFDWAVANAILPAQVINPDTGLPAEGLDFIERSAARDEIGEVAGGLHEIQTAMDEANGGVNPLGFDSDAITFDINQEFYQNNSGADRRSHFEQVYARAVTAGNNAVSVLQFATQANNKLRAISDDTNATIIDSLRQDIDYRNRLIEIFGTPYTGQIGFGKAYPEGYQGPDTMLYAYLDKTTIDQIVPSNTSNDVNVVTFTTINTKATGMMSNATLTDLYNKASAGSNITNDFKTFVGNNLYGPETAAGVPYTVSYNTASKYAFQAPTDGSWGKRTSYGRVQTALGDMLSAEIALDSAIADYIGFLQDFEQKLRNLQSELELFAKKDGKDTDILTTRATVNSVVVALESALAVATALHDGADDVAKALAAAFPGVSGPFAFDVTSIARGLAYASLVPIDEAYDGVRTGLGIGKAVAELLRDELINKFERDKGYIDEVGTIQGLVAELEYHSGSDQPKRDAIGMAAQELTMKGQELTTALAEGFRLLREREAFNKVLAANTQRNRYQDMIFRLTRNEAMSKFQSSFNNAARYAWLATRAYDYETSLEPGDPAAPGELFDAIVKERQLGLWAGGVPSSGQGGLAEILAQMNANFQALKGHLGIDNPQQELEKISLREELFRVGPTLDPAYQAALDTPVAYRTDDQKLLIATTSQDTINQAAASDQRFKDALKARIVTDLTTMPEFVRYCRPFSTPAEGPQPGIVIRFPTQINNGVNFFGKALVAGDHKYSNANYATKLRAMGAWLANYSAAGLVISPRAYLVPIGDDYLRTSSSPQPITRVWSVKEQRIPTPYVLNQGQIKAPTFIPTLNGVDGNFGDLRRHGDFRVYHDNGDPTADDSELTYDDRLVGRSVWNSEWMLVIPGANLAADPMDGVTKFAETVSDIKIYFDTYSHQGR